MKGRYILQSIKLLSLFSGLGAFEKAFTNLSIPFEIVYYSEIDKQVSNAYSILHNVPISKNLGDVTTIDYTKLDNIDIDLMTWGFPCVACINTNRKYIGFEKNEEYFNIASQRTTETKTNKNQIVKNSEK